MKKSFLIIAIIMLVAALICFFPFTRSISIEGEADILNLEKEKIGDCELDIEITETRSLLFCYSKYFEFGIDGKQYSYFELAPFSEAGGLSLISTYFYSEEKDRMTLCTLTYPQDMTYFVIRTDTNLYYLDNCTGIAPEELPVSFSAEE